MRVHVPKNYEKKQLNPPNVKKKLYTGIHEKNIKYIYTYICIVLK